MNNPENTPSGVLQVLFIAAEADPFIKVGGLGDVTGSLPPILRSLDPSQTGGQLLDVRLVIPFHGAISLPPENCQLLTTFTLPYGKRSLEVQAFQTHQNGVPVYLIAGEPIPPEAPVYSMNTAQDGEKYTFFSLAALELARKMDWQPDILHANDWHTAISVYMLNLLRSQRDSFFSNTHSVLSIHNLPFMGGGIESALQAYGIQPSSDPKLPEWARYFPLPMGLSTADRIVAVSPTYAKEILTPEFGCGLQDFLATRKNTVSGILNGLDEANWDPSNDPALSQPFSQSSLPDRMENKKAILEEFSLNPDLDLPLLIFIGRMDRQKGVDIVIQGLRQMSGTPWQAILLGSGDPILEDEVRKLEADFPDRVRAAIRFDPQLSRRLYAGGDCLLMPSRYEPCGLAQMIAMRYGCIPIGRAVGGLRDTIVDLPDSSQSTGFLFKEASADSLVSALRRALEQYPNHQDWQARQILAMQQDFSWQRSAISYAGIYHTWREKS